jgi:hypothetical protein
MAIKRNLISSKDLNMETFDCFMQDEAATPYSIDYDPVFDALFVYIKPAKKETIVQYVTDRLGLIYEYKTKEVIGVQIDAFNKKFLKEYPKLRKAWEFEDCGDFASASREIEERKPIIAREVVQVAECALATD